LRAFESDLAAINEHTDYHFSGLTLVGKADVCPYVYNGEIDEDEIYHRCLELQENTERIMSEAVEDGLADRRAEAGLALARRAETDSNKLTVEGESAPYQEAIPEELGEEYCPFYAQHFVNDFFDKQPVKVHQGTTAIETLHNGMLRGTCPHAAMKQMVPDADLLIGNYKHAFGPMTVENFTGGLFDDSTILIVDEAHEMVNEVRNELSYSVSMETLWYAIRDVEMVLRWLRGEGHGGKVNIATSIVEKADYSMKHLKLLKKFLENVYQIFSQEINDHLSVKHGVGWQTTLNPDQATDDSVPVQTDSSDVLTAWVAKNGVEEDWKRALYLSYSVAYIRSRVMKKIDQMTPNGEFAIEKVRELLKRWLLGDHTEYFRELKLSPHRNPRAEGIDGKEWQRAYSVSIRVNNCIPQDEIAGTIDSFGGAIVMSATLEPIDVYTEVTGIDKLEQGIQPSQTLVTKAADRYKKLRNIDDGEDSQDEESDSEERPTPAERSRHVSKTVFGIDFPEENRETVAVPAPKFTWSERWPPEEHPDLRRIYRNVLIDVVTTTPGNVLIFMPSYAEAEWAADILRDSSRVDKPVLADESSSDATTEQLKEEFFSGGAKVLTTGLRGTLTEGVDFDGDKLHGVAICGVPISNTGTKLADAIQDAYADRFGDWLGFQYAYTVPAIHKTRQALGRVIRGEDDVGVRVLVDERYTPSAGNASVLEHFPNHARDEISMVEPDDLEWQLRRFWSSVDGI